MNSYPSGSMFAGFVYAESNDWSEIRCKCGRWFRWTGIDPGLTQFLDEHRPHNVKPQELIGGMPVDRAAELEIEYLARQRLALDSLQAASEPYDPLSALELRQLKDWHQRHGCNSSPRSTCAIMRLIEEVERARRHRVFWQDVDEAEAEHKRGEGKVHSGTETLTHDLGLDAVQDLRPTGGWTVLWDDDYYVSPAATRPRFVLCFAARDEAMAEKARAREASAK